MPILGLEPTQFYSEGFWQHALPNWASERYMPIFGLETTQINSEGYWQHAFNYMGCRKKYADIGT